MKGTLYELFLVSFNCFIKKGKLCLDEKVHPQGFVVKPGGKWFEMGIWNHFPWGKLDISQRFTIKAGGMGFWMGIKT